MNHNQNNRSVKFTLLALIAAILAAFAGLALLAAAPAPSGAAIPQACPVSVKVTPQLDDVTLIEITGIIQKNDLVTIGAEGPGLIIVSGDKAYELVFTTNPGLQAGANQLVGACVKVTGLLVKVGVEQPVHDAVDVDTLISAP